MASSQAQTEAEPALRSLLTRKADMSTLGAQARAAEYAAATAARARQVSREAEDQNVPPKNAPVSLSAFSKSQPASTRNKGTKAWKQFTLTDIDEDRDRGDLSQDSDCGAPTPATGNILPGNMVVSKLRKDSVVFAPGDKVKVNIPKAPRAMLGSRAPATIVSDATALRSYSQSFAETTPQSQQVLETSPSPYHYGGYPNPGFAPVPYLPGLMMLGTPGGNERTHFQMLGSMMLPDDMSPLKQEQKFARINATELQANEGYLSATGQASITHIVRQQQLLTENDQYIPVNPDTVLDDGPYTYDVSSHSAPYPRQNIHNHSQFEGINSGYRETPGLGTYYPDPSLHPDLLHHAMISQDSYSLPQDTHVTSQHAQYCPQTPTTSISRYTTLDYEEPYDRKTKMQTFVATATQEARKGKTVLHNPDLHKDVAQSNDNTTGRSSLSRLLSNTDRTKRSVPGLQGQPRYDRVPWKVRAPDSLQEVVIAGRKLPQNLMGAELEVIAKAINNPAPGLSLPDVSPGVKKTNDFFNKEPSDDTFNLHGGVGSEEWTQLRPFTRAERDRVRGLMAKAAADCTNTIDQPMTSTTENGASINQAGLITSQEWFRSDNRGEEELRAQIPALTSNHAKKLRAAAAKDHGGVLPKDFKVGVDDGIVANLVLGDVIANLRTYAYGDAKSVAQRKNFFKVKSVPEFAVERGSLFGGHDETRESYFDGDQGGFHGAPVRIARDPRFRPQGKDGLMTKPEEEWKNRHEMYGRRLM